jgi:ArsR family transcriptional regulator
MDIEQYSAALLKALAHPARLRILRTLQIDGECCVCHLETRLDVRQAYLSQQLARLRKAGLVEDRREGLNVFYTLARSEIDSLLATVQDSARALARHNLIELKADRHPNDLLEACPCPHCRERLQSQHTASVPAAKGKAIRLGKKRD